MRIMQKVFVMNYSDLKEQMADLTGYVMSQLNPFDPVLDFSEDGVCAVSYDAEGFCLFQKHTETESWIRVEFIGTAK